MSAQQTVIFNANDFSLWNVTHRYKARDEDAVKGTPGKKRRRPTTKKHDGSENRAESPESEDGDL
jgi:hypothetical protein